METETTPEAPKILGTAKVLGDILITKYDRRESQTLARILVEFVTKKTYKWLLMHPEATFSPQEYFEWQAASNRLLLDEPLQYIIGEAHFMGLDLVVNKDVLIPRPETEELVHWILEGKDHSWQGQIVDIGTGSGCIALALASALPLAQVTGMDISPGAAAVAAQNAERLRLPATFVVEDVRDASPTRFAYLDVLVSNPPYIPQSEHTTLDPHVLHHEPATALAVPDDDPLLYYKCIAELGMHWLRPGGRLYFEIHADYGAAMCALLSAHGYQDVALRQDMAGRDRMVAGLRPA